jgi:hypothetical protein
MFRFARQTFGLFERHALKSDAEAGKGNAGGALAHKPQRKMHKICAFFRHCRKIRHLKNAAARRRGSTSDSFLPILKKNEAGLCHEFFGNRSPVHTFGTSQSCRRQARILCIGHIVGGGCTCQ